MRLSEMRKHIQDNYLKNNIISGSEAKELVGLLAKDGLTATEKKNLEKIRSEFKDLFSSAGLREFDRALRQAAASGPAPTGTPGSGNTVLDVRLGRTLPAADRPIRISSVEDSAVRAALRRLDFNNDNQVDVKDRDKMGFSDQQWRSFIYFAALMGAKIEHGDNVIPANFHGAKVVLTAVPDKQKAAEWARAMGAKVVAEVAADVDYLIVGNAASTGKDERAHALNALGAADIKVCDYNSFADRAVAAGVTGSAPARLSHDQLMAKIGSAVESWYEEHIREHYAEELAEATAPDERARVEADMRTDLDSGAEWSVLGDGDLGAWEDVRDDPNGTEFRDRFGVAIPNSEVVEVAVDFFPEYAGIGLGTYMVFDGRTGEHLDTSDIHD
ncbi:MAG: hypothetical protein JXR83_11515 [Deltaproteobacteria bacterium]|nr:hypothetical protein [Deltaproteobacteria bacterium]